MNDPVVIKFAETTKKRVTCFVAFLVLFLPAMCFKYLVNAEVLFGFERMNVVIALQFLSLIPIFLSLRYFNCPACNKKAGYGWSIKQCTHCGKKLT